MGPEIIRGLFRTPMQNRFFEIISRSWTEFQIQFCYSMFSTEKGRIFGHGIFLALFLIAFASLEAASASMMDDKRAGFVGMRGKKDHFNFNDYLEDPSSYYDAAAAEAKRAGSGFVGMRGKKDAEDQEDLFYAPIEEAKRAGFVGM